MKSEVSTLESNKVKVSVEVDEAEIDAHIDEAFRKIAKEVRLPGFRPGKAPRKVLEARIGKDYARGEALREALPEYYRRAIIEHEVDVIAPPELDITDGEDDGPVAFEAVVEVRPTVTVAGYNGLQIELPAPGVSDDDVESQLEGLRRQFAERVDVDRPAADGDYVTMDIATTHDGEPVEGMTADGYTYELGAGFVVDEMDDALRGVEVGATVDFEAEHPDPDEEGMLTFEIEVTGIQENQLPEVDDDFATEATEFQTAAELLDDTRARLDAMKRSQAQQLMAERTGEALAELVTDDIPEALVDDQVQQQIQDMAMRLAQQGMQFEQFMQMTGQDPDSLRDSLKEPAERAARVDLALRAVATAEALEISDDEIQAEIDESAAAMGQDGAQLRAAFEDAGQLSSLRADMLKRKAMDMLLETVSIVDPDGHPIDRADIEPIDDDPDTSEESDDGDEDGGIDPAATAESGDTQGDADAADNHDDGDVAEPDEEPDEDEADEDE